MTVAVVVGNPKPASRTLAAAELVAQRLAGAPADLVIDVAGGRDAGAAARKAEHMTTVSAPAPLGAAELRRAFGCFPSGVVGLCALVNAVPVGMAASSFTSVSLDPALVSVCVASSSTTW